MVPHDRPQCLADGGIPALCRQCDLRRCRHVGGDAAPAPHLSRETRRADTAPPLDRAIGFVLDSQYPNGGWPQRWPHVRDYPGLCRLHHLQRRRRRRRISASCSMVYQSLGEERVRPAILRAGEVFLATQQPMPQPGWSLQHTLDLKPAGARSYEPLSLATHTTAANLSDDDAILPADRRTALSRPDSGGDRLARIAAPAARSGAPAAAISRPSSRSAPTGRATSTGAARTSSTARYYWDYSPVATLGHYGAFARDRHRRAAARLSRGCSETPREEVLRNSPLRAPGHAPLPRFFVTGLDVGSDLNAAARGRCRPRRSATLNAEGWWPTPLRATSNPYRGPGPRRAAAGRFPHHPCRRLRATPRPTRTDRPVHRHLDRHLHRQHGAADPRSALAGRHGTAVALRGSCNVHLFQG